MLSRLEPRALSLLARSEASFCLRGGALGASSFELCRCCCCCCCVSARPRVVVVRSACMMTSKQERKKINSPEGRVSKSWTNARMFRFAPCSPKVTVSIVFRHHPSQRCQPETLRRSSGRPLIGVVILVLVQEAVRRFFFKGCIGRNILVLVQGAVR